jgi:hypothetical protein
VTIRPGTTSSASPTRANGTAFTCSPVKVIALAAVGCRAATPSDEAPGVTGPAPAPAPAVAGWSEPVAVVARVLRFCEALGRAAQGALPRLDNQDKEERPSDSAIDLADPVAR